MKSLWTESSFVDAICFATSNGHHLAVLDANIHATPITELISGKSPKK